MADQFYEPQAHPSNPRAEVFCSKKPVLRFLSEMM